MIIPDSTNYLCLWLERHGLFLYKAMLKKFNDLNNSEKFSKNLGMATCAF